MILVPLLRKAMFAGAIASLCVFATPQAGQTADAKAPAMRNVDTHAHVFKRGLPLAPNRRYAPDYDATPEDFIRQLDAHQMAVGILVQPSFLGTNNDYLLDALKKYPDRLRGVVVVDPAISAGELAAMDKLGVVGLRLNLVGLDIPDFSKEPWPALLATVKQLGWHVELHRQAKDLPQLIEPLQKAGVRIVVDHFGRPDPGNPMNDPGFQYLLTKGGTGGIWVKVSGAYRIGGLEKGVAFAKQAIPLLLKSYGAEFLLWGSDWPHTGNEKDITYEATYNAFKEYVPDAGVRHTILSVSPWKLIGKSSK